MSLTVPVTRDDHLRGLEDALVAMVEYGDYECGYCSLAHPIVNTVQRHFGTQLCFAFRHFPLSQAHPHATMAAEAAEFAGAHGKFWEMHDLLYENQERLSPALFAELAEHLELPLAELGNVLQNGTYTTKIRRDFLGGVRSGVNGTPTFFINGVRHDGSYLFEDLVAAINKSMPLQLQSQGRHG